MSADADNIFSSYREMILEYLFASEVMRHLWLRDFGRMEMLRPQVDDSGYDLVLEANRVVRHVQLKASHHEATTNRANVNISLAEKPSGCVIWLLFDRNTLELGPFLWFGREPGEKLPDLSPFSIAKAHRGNAQGIKPERQNIRVVPRSCFKHLNSIDEVVSHLFGSDGQGPTLQNSISN